MKSRFITYLRPFFGDRYIIVLVSLIALLALGICVYMGFIIRPTELQVVSHYTSFGGTNFYRDKWYYLLGFMAYVVLVTVAHLAIMIKIYAEKNRELAITFGWATVLLLIIALFMIRSILQIAQLS